MQPRASVLTVTTAVVVRTVVAPAVLRTNETSFWSYVQRRATLFTFVGLEWILEAEGRGPIGVFLFGERALINSTEDREGKTHASSACAGSSF